MAVEMNLPNGTIILGALGLSLERLQQGSKAAVSLPVLKAILCTAVAGLRFDPEFYLRAYPDIQSAYDSGKITDLRTHFIEFGYLEGRMGSEPEFDEEFYKATYPDVAAALAKGAIKSARDHYIYSGFFEGRYANASAAEMNKWWSELLRST